MGEVRLPDGPDDTIQAVDDLAFAPPRGEVTEAALEDVLPDSELAEIRGGVGALRRELAPI